MFCVPYTVMLVRELAAPIIMNSCMCRFFPVASTTSTSCDIEFVVVQTSCMLVSVDDNRVLPTIVFFKFRLIVQCSLHMPLTSRD